MLCNNSSNCLQSLKTIDGSCWIWWWAQHQNPCFLIYCRSKSFWLYQEVVLHCCLQNYRCCICQSNNFWIAHPKGCWHNNLEDKSYQSKKLEALQWKRRNQPLRINQVIIWVTAICKITKNYTSIGVMHLTVLTINLCLQGGGDVNVGYETPTFSRVNVRIPEILLKKEITVFIQKSTIGDWMQTATSRSYLITGWTHSNYSLHYTLLGTITNQNFIRLVW